MNSDEQLPQSPAPAPTPEIAPTADPADAPAIPPDAITEPITVDPSTAPAQPVAASAQSSAAPAKAPRSDSWVTSIQSLLVTIAIAVFVITFIVQAFEIPSESMENTLLIGDYLLVDKTHYGPGGHWSWLMPYRKIQRGDIIVFRYPIHPAEHFVKRVIGVPGDRVKIVRKRVYVNNAPQSEPYTIFREPYPESFRDNFPSGNRLSEHIDSKWYVQLDRLVEDGELIVPAGNYFVLGDNRDQSLDSRYWGFVPQENIVGRPLIIYFSLGDDQDDVEQQDGKLPLSNLLARLRHDIRWPRIMRIVR